MCASACVLIWSFTSGTSHVYHDTCITIYAHVSVCLLTWGCLDVTCISDLYEHILCYEWPHTRHSCVRMSIALRLSWRDLYKWLVWAYIVLWVTSHTSLMCPYVYWLEAVLTSINIYIRMSCRAHQWVMDVLTCINIYIRMPILSTWSFTRPDKRTRTKIACYSRQRKEPCHRRVNWVMSHTHECVVCDMSPEMQGDQRALAHFDTCGWSHVTHTSMSLVAHINASCHTHEWVTSNTSMSHGYRHITQSCNKRMNESYSTRMNESCRTHLNESCRTHQWAMDIHKWMSHDNTHINETCNTRMNESCRTHEWVMDIHTWMCHDNTHQWDVNTHMNESCKTRMIESCRTHEWVMDIHTSTSRATHTSMSRVTHVWMSHVTHMYESCRTREWVMDIPTSLNRVTHTLMSRVTRIWMSRITHVWMSHVAHK